MFFAFSFAHVCLSTGSTTWIHKFPAAHNSFRQCSRANWKSSQRPRESDENEMNEKQREKRIKTKRSESTNNRIKRKTKNCLTSAKFLTAANMNVIHFVWTWIIHFSVEAQYLILNVVRRSYSSFWVFVASHGWEIISKKRTEISSVSLRLLFCTIFTFSLQSFWNGLGVFHHLTDIVDTLKLAHTLFKFQIVLHLCINSFRFHFAFSRLSSPFTFANKQKKKKTSVWKHYFSIEIFFGRFCRS